ncbi:MAG: aminoacyl-tRNA hydrolase [Deltaproteobacteria bacterium]|nr:aminoacyl-tRNA hydrolase [Deltaproteobacteria bacterium]
MDLIAGLGNPGKRYADTRHNIGFMVIKTMCRELGVSLSSRRFRSRNALVQKDEKEIILLRPSTYMNLSGKAVKECADYYRIDNNHILIIHDDLDQPLGKIKLVSQGGAGGHRGIQSIIDHFGSKSFPRIKIGIGRPEYGEKIEDYVLSPFYESQKEILEEVIKFSIHACDLYLSEGVEVAMNHINGKNLKLLKEGINECRD